MAAHMITVRWVMRSIPHGGPIELFLIWCNKGIGMCYLGYGMVQVKDFLMLLGNSP